MGMGNIIMGIDDKEEVLKLIEEDGDNLLSASTELKDDKEVVLEAVKRTGHAYVYASKKLQNDKEIILTAMKQDKHLEWDTYFEVYVNDELKDDKEFILEAIKENEYILPFVSDRLKDDKEVVLEALKYNRDALEYASDRLKDDKEFMLEVVKENESYEIILYYASKRLRDDKDIVLVAVEHNGLELEYASDRLKDDKEVVLEAVLDNGLALEFASDRLKNDTDVVLQAVGMNDEAITYIGDTLRNNREFFKSLVGLCGTVLLYDEGEAFRDDKEIVLKAIKASPDVTQCISDRLKDDEEVMLLAATRGSGLEFASDRLKNDEEFIKKLYSEGYYDLEPLCFILKQMGCKLKSNSKFMLSLVEKYGNFLPVLEFVDKDIDDYKKIAKEALIKDINSIEYLKEELKNDKAFILDILKDIQMNYNVYSSLYSFLPDDVFNEISLELKLQDFKFDEKLSCEFTDNYDLPF